MESTTKEGASVAEGLPEEANAIGDSRKTTETETHSSLATVYACTVNPRQIWVQTNQIRAILGLTISRNGTDRNGPEHLTISRNGSHAGESEGLVC